MSIAPEPLRRLSPWVLLAGGLVGLAAAFVLMVEKIRILEDPDYVPSCSINPVLSCGSVMTTGQAEAFGFPNPLIGIAGFAATAAIGALMLTGARLPRRFRLSLLGGTAFGIGFVHWLMFQSLYRIDALCPYCMAVWAVMIPVFWYTALYVLAREPLPAGAARAVRAATAYHGVVLTAWYLAIALLILERFWSYWVTLV
ncbi:vitamin K epoxide reductase family protein [Yinghuangia soli]|uniref:Vitamin K epoxide reductase family protein n=1 Tax=Yinghuangia soli TaxID=2908204 RepID=A0AA41U4T8_9ACTN|nr:vitamin K epoxide reductase family protein [Yinghuangia soli]MCF2533295.1 vitamin K epoxide reductase family protein [Yinghuangia soli]